MPIDETESPCIGRKFLGSPGNRDAYALVASGVARPLSIFDSSRASDARAAGRCAFSGHDSLRTDRRLVQDLNDVSIRIADVKRHRAVAMTAQGLGHVDLFLLHPLPCRFHIRLGGHDEAEMVEMLGVGIAAGSAMQRQIVASAA